MTADDHPAMELTRNPVDGSYGFICREHGIHRAGLTQQHALNVERLHLRVDHPDSLDLEVDLSAAARMFLADQDSATRDLWASLFGMEGEDAREGGDAYRLAMTLVRADRPVRAVVIPL